MTLAPARPFKDYIGWLQRQDIGAAEAYWRRRLAGFETPTAVGLGRPAAPAQPGARHAGDRYAEHACELAAALSEVEGFARRHRLTVNTLVQGAWALLLGRYGDSDDVVFGVTVSGRPAELPEVERTVGLFVNTLPLRVALPPGETVLDWLREVQARQTEILPIFPLRTNSMALMKCCTLRCQVPTCTTRPNFFGPQAILNREPAGRYRRRAHPARFRARRSGWRRTCRRGRATRARAAPGAQAHPGGARESWG